MQRILIASALASAAAINIPADQYAALVAEVNSLKNTVVLPAGVSRTDTDALVERLYNAKQTIADLSKAQPTATFGVTKFSLLSTAEFKKMYFRSFGKNHIVKSSADAVSLPKGNANGTVDWTTSSCVNPVKDQGQCGSCWAFSATGAIESAHCIATGTLLNLAEQQVVSCENADGQQGCNGGDEELAMSWISIDNAGQCLTKDYPYTSGDTTETGTCVTGCVKQTLAVHNYTEAIGEAKLEVAIVQQPTTVAVEAGNPSWQHYKGGVVTHCPGAESDHAVIAVGYGSDNGVDYFKIRNSWAADWGEKGYIRLQRGVGGVGMCNVAQEPAYPNIVGGPTPTKPAC